jgi:hypothetical protein
MPETAIVSGLPLGGGEYAIVRLPVRASWPKRLSSDGGDGGLVVTNRRILILPPPGADDFFASLVDETQRTFLRSVTSDLRPGEPYADRVLSIPLSAIRSIAMARRAWPFSRAQKLCLSFEVLGAAKKIAVSWPMALGRDFAKSTVRRFLDACIVAGAAIKPVRGPHYAIRWG